MSAEFVRLSQVVRDVSSAYAAELRKKSPGPGLKRVFGYLADRGIYSHAVEEFSLGFALPDSTGVVVPLKTGHSPADLMAVGAIVRVEGGRYVDPLAGRLIFPQATPGGHMVGFIGRSIGGNAHDKYRATTATDLFRRSELLYRIDRARPFIEAEGAALVVEGYIDAVVLWQMGLRHVVAVGTATLSEPQAQILARYAGRLNIMFDNDEPGSEGFLAARKSRARWFAAIDRVTYPSTFKDPADWALSKARGAGVVAR